MYGISHLWILRNCVKRILSICLEMYEKELISARDFRALSALIRRGRGFPYNSNPCTWRLRFPEVRGPRERAFPRVVHARQARSASNGPTARSLPGATAVPQASATVRQNISWFEDSSLPL